MTWGSARPENVFRSPCEESPANSQPSPRSLPSHSRKGIYCSSHITFAAAVDAILALRPHVRFARHSSEHILSGTGHSPEQSWSTSRSFLPRSGFWECLCPQHPKSMSFSASWLHAGALRSRKVKLPCLQRFSCSLPHSRHCRVKRLLFVSAAWLLRHTGVKSKLLG